MLIRLHVRNYTLISELDLELGSGFSVVTGETGAGKSIILGALKLILGERADSKVLFESDVKCVVEGAFEIKAYGLQGKFEEHDLDYFDQTIIRREILPSGKSRAFINDTPVTLSVLKEFGDRLVDIHSQHETLQFRSRSFQYEILDAYAGAMKLKKDYLGAYDKYQFALDALEALKEEERNSKLDLDYYRFQLDELETAQLRAGELAQLEEEFGLLSRSEDVQRAFGMANDLLNGPRGITELLYDLKDTFGGLKGAGERFDSYHTRLETAYIELQDLAREISTNGEIDFDPSRLSELNERLNLINGLMQKHRLNNEEELIALRDELASRVGNVGSLDERLAELENELQVGLEKCLEIGEKLHAKRVKATTGLTKEIEKILGALSMKDASLMIEMSEADAPNGCGTSELEMKFKANKGTEYELIHKAASGGELARLMLSVKSIVAGKKALPTVIFDEIDTGVSGEVASRIGAIKRSMSKDIQVISITHLPQVAGKADNHFLVYKETKGDKTLSTVKRIEGDERITEIAKMLSGDKVGEAAIQTARELMINPN